MSAAQMPTAAFQIVREGERLEQRGQRYWPAPAVDNMVDERQRGHLLAIFGKVPFHSGG
jgi:hypothetical protein